MISRVQNSFAGTPRRGAIALLAAVFLVMIFAFTAFTVDIGYVSLVDQELQGAVDAAALAGAYELKLASSTRPVFEAAKQLASKNRVNGQSLDIIPRKDVEVGFWDEATRTFTPMPTVRDLTLANAVRVNGRLSNNRNSQVNLFFAPILGHRQVEMSSSAIAVIGRDRPRDVMLVIDRSGSMDAYNRMVYTRSAALQLVDELTSVTTSSDRTKSDRVGLAAYSFYHTEVIEVPSSGGSGRKKGMKRRKSRTRTTTVSTWEGELVTSLSWNFAPTLTEIPLLQPSGRTNIGGGMRVGIEELMANKRVDATGEDVQQILVLMTDGHANETEPPGTTPTNSIYYYAELARQNDIIIHGITLGSGAEKGPIRYAADHTGGEYHHVEDGDFEGLFEIYRGIGRGADQPRLVR